MARGIRHSRSNRATSRRGSQGSAPHGTGTTSATDASQRNRVAPPQQEPAKKRGRKPGSKTKLAQPLLGNKVLLKPNGDMQFLYVNYNDNKPPYKYTTQLGVIIRREYPGVIEDRDENGALIRKRPAMDWADYFWVDPTNQSGVTSGDRVLSEFWRLFKVSTEDEEEADRVLEIYLKKRVRDLMYAARVDCVKEYYRGPDGKTIDDALACPIELRYEQYIEGRLVWCNDEVWPLLCSYWCTAEFLEKRKIGQQCRLSTGDIAQNHGGSRPFTETQQVLEKHFGPQKASPLNTYAVMKSGLKNVDTSGSSGPISSQRAQQRIDDYMAGVSRVPPPNEEDQEHEHNEEEGEEDMDEEVEEESQQVQEESQLNGKVLYDMSGGTPHGRFAIGNGAVRAADVRAAAKENNVRPSNSVSTQNIIRENAHLRSENTRLQHEKECEKQQSKVFRDLLLGLYQHLGKEIPEQALRVIAAAQATQVTRSSHVGSESSNDGIAADGHSAEGIHAGNRGLQARNCHGQNMLPGEGEGEGATPIQG